MDESNYPSLRHRVDTGRRLSSLVVKHDRQSPVQMLAQSRLVGNLFRIKVRV